MKTNKQVMILRSDKEVKGYGKVSNILFPDGSKIYISKKGWTLVTPDKTFKKNILKAKKWGKIELTIPYSEINMAIQETIKAGYKE